MIVDRNIGSFSTLQARASASRMRSSNRSWSVWSAMSTSTAQATPKGWRVSEGGRGGAGGHQNGPRPPVRQGPTFTASPFDSDAPPSCETGLTVSELSVVMGNDTTDVPDVDLVESLGDGQQGAGRGRAHL